MHASSHWPHAPLHRLSGEGAFLITAGTYKRQLFFLGPERLDYLETRLLGLLKERDWRAEAWAVFPNHYHVVVQAGKTAQPLGALRKQRHVETARWVNALDGAKGRKVWFNYWDTRLAYVHQNPVKHGWVPEARHYRWCSAGWLELNASKAMVETLKAIPGIRSGSKTTFNVECGIPFPPQAPEYASPKAAQECALQSLPPIP
jgi:putative transposase